MFLDLSLGRMAYTNGILTGYMIYIGKILIIATVQGISPHPWVKLGGVDLFNYVLNSCGNVTNNQKLVDTVEDAL